MNQIALDKTSLATRMLMSVLLVLSMSLFSMFAMAVGSDSTDTSDKSVRDFNHMTTGFPLTGLHATVECGSCHVGGIFKGTPRNCAGCHSKGRRVTATVMPSNHIVTTDPCEVCHSNTVTFLGARYNHGKAQPGSCATCHNGMVATGKPSNHSGGMKATASCDKCHRTFAWLPSTFNHTGVTPGSCATSCHDGVSAIGRPASHSSTSLKSQKPCDACHRYTGWYPTFYDHSAVAPGTCSTCHNAVSATGKPSNHTGSRATQACDSCHSTAAWLPAGYNHSGVVPGTCSTCHEAQRPTTHASKGYTGSCDKCHAVGSSWAFNHAAQQGLHLCNNCHQKHHNTTPCDNCHTVNTWNK